MPFSHGMNGKRNQARERERHMMERGYRYVYYTIRSADKEGDADA